MYRDGNKYIFNQKEQEYIINQYKEGKFLKDIARKYNISIRPIKRILQKNNIQIRKVRRYYKINHNYFSDLNSEDKVYWLGFIIADGSLVEPNRIRISLSTSDREHLNKFLVSLNSNYNIYDYKDMSEVTITSDKIFNDLQKNNLHPNKVHNIEMPNIKSNFLSHFWRGVFDGDGALFFQRKSWILSLTGAEDIIICFQKYAQNYSHAKAKINSKFNSYCFKTTGNRITPILAKKLYENSSKSIRLDRKYEKYLEMCEFLEKRR
jgi:intein-encoded DNA endonuclease-like protein